ncbi:hypothetical protein [Luteipulveratus mongoliensis]|uniref:Uncharacterized protein n=1 Tax=Luteipulveratus mongoliensis TaxID=571913 RepID=A0A0K1JKQ6_9MICO|nr:hypothetical protein [Luteipulveratus mongoliensis]AKU17292.1 hypothetical protein VV02_17935 [Luteipulveratus mongoliensis]
MGRFEEYTPAELEQRERDQQDPVFVAWLAAMYDELALFFEKDVPDMPADPWTVEGLRHAEQAALRWYWDREPGDLSWRREREKRFQRYLGEVFVRNFEGSWRWIAMRPQKSSDKEPVIDEPAMGSYFEVARHVGAAMSERTGEKWARLFGRAQKNYDAWVEAGRLPPKEWEDYLLAQDMNRLGVGDGPD